MIGGREKIVRTALLPADTILGAAVSALDATVGVDTITDRFYEVARNVLGLVYKKNNELTATGTEQVPTDGGAIFASNHQSWNDVQVIGATSPRRLRFLAKAEFETWPILRHLVPLSGSTFIRRGGDTEGLAKATELLEEGNALMIFPEGTIPGEESLMRHEVEPETGLLRGRSGAVRLAIAAKVPIVPIGVSGTGASFPPEVYPRLELLEAPKPVPITVRYGEPLTFEDLYDKELTRDDLRTATDRLMRAISDLVEHKRNYIPLTVPIPPLPRYEKLGVLLLHGFTSSVRTVDGLVPHIENAGLPYRIPVLRGHGTHFADLAGVTADDWYADAERSLLELSQEVDRVVVVGLSMGGLLALNLGIDHADKIAGVLTLAAALRFVDPLAPIAPMLSRVIKSWPSPDAIHDPALKGSSENYPRFMTEAFGSLLEYARNTEKRLANFDVPICVVHSKKDQVIAPVSANLIYRDVSSEHREIHWFQHSGHEMGQDLEKDAVFERVIGYIEKLRAPVEPETTAASE